MITLDPNSEFEAALIDMVRMHREKAAAYGTDKDPMQNFYNIAGITFATPLQACEVLLAKHASVVKGFLESGKIDKYSDDAFLDRAVYGVLSMVLYAREKAEV